MNNRNGDHVAISTEYGAGWDFVVPSAATTYSEQAIEMTQLCTQLFNTFEDYLTPIELTYIIQLYHKDEKLISSNKPSEPAKTVEQTVENDSGVTALEFIASTQIEQSSIRRIPQIPFNHNRLKLRFDDDDHFIDRSDCMVYRNGEIVNRTPNWDPLTLKAAFARNRHYNAIDSNYIYYISIWLSSDIWFKKSEIGKVNRNYLSTFLERIEHTLPVEHIDREVYSMSDMWTDLDIQQQSELLDLKEIY